MMLDEDLPALEKNLADFDWRKGDEVLSIFGRPLPQAWSLQPGVARILSIEIRGRSSLGVSFADVTSLQLRTYCCSVAVPNKTCPQK